MIEKEFIELQEKVKTLEKTVLVIDHRKVHCDERRSAMYDRISQLEQSRVRTEEKFKTVFEKLDTIIHTLEKMNENKRMWVVTITGLVLSPLFTAVILFFLTGKMK